VGAVPGGLQYRTHLGVFSLSALSTCQVLGSRFMVARVWSLWFALWQSFQLATDPPQHLYGGNLCKHRFLKAAALHAGEVCTRHRL
jgi:hypothetical protein